jgi:hypothetical protein
MMMMGGPGGWTYDTGIFGNVLMKEATPLFILRYDFDVYDYG